MNNASDDVSLVVDPSTLSIGTSLLATGNVAVRLGSQWFPSERWNDFVVVIVEAWASALWRLLSRTSTVERVHFMEGPFEVRLQAVAHGILTVEALERPNKLRASLNSDERLLATSAVVAADATLQACASAQYRSADVGRLEDAQHRLVAITRYDEK